MPVKCIDPSIKPLIAHAYSVDGVDTDTLALCHAVSKRTIQRVLVEQGANKGRSRYRRAKRNPAQLELPITMIEPTFMESLFAFVKSIFTKKTNQANVHATK